VGFCARPLCVFDFFDFQSTEIKREEPKRRSKHVEACTHVPAIRGRDTKALRTMGRPAAQRELRQTVPHPTRFLRRSRRATGESSFLAAYDFFDFL
jgi:hypothetical protein